MGLKIILCKGRFAGPISGSDETLIAYATQLHAQGYDVSVTLVYPHTSADPYFLRLREAGIPVSSVVHDSTLHRTLRTFRSRLPHLPTKIGTALRKTNYSLSASYLDQCKKHLNKNRPDLIHVITPDPSVMTMIRAAHETGVPVLYQELGTPNYLPEMNFYYDRLAEVLPLCSEVAALSPILARQFSEKFVCPSPVTVLPLSLAVEPISKGNDQTTHLSASAGPVTFGFAARMEYGKGPLALVEAFARVHHQYSNCRLLMAGEGPQKAEIAALIQEHRLNNVCILAGTYNGERQKSDFMRQIDVFVLPSLAEGTPNSIIEAMGHGIPTIATTVGGIPDILPLTAGLLIEPANNEALAEAMLAVATQPEPRQQMGEAARRHYETNFAPEKALPILLATYQRVASMGENSTISAN